MKRVLLLTKDVKQWLDKFQMDVEFDRVRRIRKLSDKDMMISNGWMEVRILDSFWRDNLRACKWDIVILDMAMELEDWEMFRINAKDYRFGERANYLMSGKKVAAFHGSMGLLEAENEKLKESEMKFEVKNGDMDGQKLSGGFVYWK